MIKIAGNKGIKTTRRICAKCGETFKAIDKTQSACTKCKKPTRVYYNHKNIVQLYELICFQCGETFTSTTPKKVFCSKECQSKSRAKPEQNYMVARQVIFRRDDYKCIYCGKSSIEDGVKLELEHIYPVVEGGREDLFNLATACEECNGQKSKSILSKEIILRIWERNEALNKQYESESYANMSAAFKKNLLLRLRQRGMIED